MLAYLLRKKVAADVRRFVTEAVYSVTMEAQHCGGQAVLYLIQELMDKLISHPPSFINKDCRNCKISGRREITYTIYRFYFLIVMNNYEK